MHYRTADTHKFNTKTRKQKEGGEGKVSLDNVQHGFVEGAKSRFTMLPFLLSPDKLDSV